MSKKFTSLLVLAAAALLLTVPAHAQIAKKAAKQQITALKAGPQVFDVQKAKDAKEKANFKAVGYAFTGAMHQQIAKATLLETAIDNIQNDKVAFEKQMEENFRAVKLGKIASILNKGNVSAKAIKNARAIALDAAKPSARRATNRAEVVDDHGIITSPAEGESKLYDRSGFGYYVQSQQLYVGEQSGKTEIVETTDGVVYIKNFISNVNTGAWVKGTKAGNTITIPAGQVIYYGTSYGLYIAKCSYVDDETGWAEVDGDITLTVDGNTISLDNTDEDNPVAAFWTDDYTFSGYGDYETVFSYDPDYVAPTLVELPEGAVVETWYNNATQVANSGNTPVETSAKIAFVGDDVYLSGIFESFPDSWIKGTINGTTVTFSGLQFIGEYSGYNIFAVGTDGEGLVDFQMTYDAAAKTLTSVNDLLANAKEDAIYYLEWYTGISITKDAPAEPVATTGADVDAPYVNALASAEDFADFGVIDSNKDGKTWAYSDSYGASYSYSSTNAANDWLISPAIKLEAGKKYHFAIDAKNNGYPEKFEVLLGTEAKASALTQTVLAATEVTLRDFVTFENEAVEVAETGYYHFGIHAISDPDQFRLMVANFVVEAGVEGTAPAAVTDLAVVQTPDELEAVVSFKAPTKTVGGADLTDLTKIDVLRDGAVVKSFESVAGNAYNWVAASAGWTHQDEPTGFTFAEGYTATLSAGTNTSNAPRYWENTSGKTLRLYNGNTLKIAGSAIAKVVITFNGNTDLAANVGTYTLDGNVATWTGSADEVVFTAGSGKAFIESIQVETGLTLTPGAEYSYVDAGLTIGNHVYQVIPYNATGVGIKSEEKTVFVSATLDVPHTFDFTQNLLDLFAVIDNNADGKTWIWSSSNGAYYPYHGTNAADDYLITLPFNLKAGKAYNVVVNAKGSATYPERMEVLAGKESTVEGLTQEVIAPTVVNAGDFVDYDGTFTPAEDGKYYFAIHAISDADELNLCVKALTIELAPEATAPAAIADLTATPGAEGALEANLAFTAPAKAINGSDLTGTVDVKIYRDNEVVNTLTGVAVGAATTWKDTDVEDGKTYTYYLVAANASGDGLKSEKASVYVGVDALGGVPGFTASNVTPSTITFTWNAAEGVHGGYINTAAIEYTIYSMHVEEVEIIPGWTMQELVADEAVATVTGRATATIDYNTLQGEQNYQYFGISAAYGTDETDPAEAYAAVLVGAPYELPIVESFTDKTLHYSWESNGGLGVDTYSSDEDGVALKLYNDGTSSEVFFALPRVDLTSAANPTIIFDAFNGQNVDKVKVVGSADGADLTVLGEFNLSSDYTTIKQVLTSIKGTAFSTVGILATIPTASVSQYEDHVIIDNIRIVDLYEYNLKADIKAPKSVVAGQKAKVVATVTNEGDNAAQGYTVTVKAGEKVITSVIGSDELAPFAKDEIEVEYETSIFDEAGDVNLTVTVDYENELYPDDNTANTIITVKEPTAGAPASLTAVDKGAEGVELTWAMPAASRAADAVTEDFEDTDVFEPFSLGGITAENHNGAFGDWKLYDGNGITVYGFNGIEFPNAYQVAAWQVVNTDEVSVLAENGYTANSGVQYLWSFCPADENNYPAADHWLISPELSGAAQTVSFYARALTAQYGAETFEVWASTTDDNVESFTKVADYSTEAVEWTEFTADLPAGAKYFAIRHTSEDIFGLLVDDVTFAAAGATAPVPTSFNIYFEKDKVASVEGDKTTYTVAVDKLTAGEHTFAVTAVYATGAESKPVTATVAVTTDIRQIAADGKAVDIYSVDGKLVRSQATSLDGLKGLYIVDGKKIMVK